MIREIIIIIDKIIMVNLDKNGKFVFYGKMKVEYVKDCLNSEDDDD